MSKLAPFLLILLILVTACNEQEPETQLEEKTTDTTLNEVDTALTEMAAAEPDHGVLFELPNNTTPLKIDTNIWQYFSLGEIMYSENGYKINFSFNSELNVGDTLGILSLEGSAKYSIIDYFNEDDWQLHPYEGQLNATSAHESLFASTNESSSFVFFHPMYAGVKVFSNTISPIEEYEEEGELDIEEETIEVFLDLNNDDLPDLKIEHYSYSQSFEGGPVEMENEDGETEHYESYGGGTEYKLKETYFIYLENKWIEIKKLSWEDFEGC